MSLEELDRAIAKTKAEIASVLSNAIKETNAPETPALVIYDVQIEPNPFCPIFKVNNFLLLSILYFYYLNFEDILKQRLA